MNENTPISRNGTADLLKGFAVLFMIQVHIMEQFATPEIQATVIGKVSLFLGGPACAPVFLAVMGYFLASGRRTFAYILKRGMLLFAGGIALNIARSANLLIHIARGRSEMDPMPFIFGADILTMAGLALILVAVLRPLARTNPWIWLAIAVAAATIAPLLQVITGTGKTIPYLLAFLWGLSDWSYFPVLPWISYVITGYAFYLLISQYPALAIKEAGSLWPFLLPAGILLAVTIPWASGITSDLAGAGGYYHHGFLFFGWTVVFMAVYLVIIRASENFYGNLPFMKAVKWTGKKVTTIYVIQWLIIGNIAFAVYQTQTLPAVITWIPVTTVATLATAWLWSGMQKGLSRRRDG
jgi:uncharacterized membrane protein